MSAHAAADAASGGVGASIPARPDPAAASSQRDHAEPPLSYEQARAELEEVVHRLEAGAVTLEESLTLWERGEELARACQSLLDGARTRLSAASQPADATPTQAPGPARQTGR